MLLHDHAIECIYVFLTNDIQISSSHLLSCAKHSPLIELYKKNYQNYAHVICCVLWNLTLQVGAEAEEL